MADAAPELRFGAGLSRHLHCTVGNCPDVDEHFTVHNPDTTPYRGNCPLTNDPCTGSCESKGECLDGD